MLIERQRSFVNRQYSDVKHQQLLNTLETTLGTSIEFRVLEAPVFCSTQLRDKIATAATELVMQCTSKEYAARAAMSIDPRYDVPGEPEKPMFAVVDFAVTQEDGEFIPKLIEFQGFPSLFAYQKLLADTFREQYVLENDYSMLFAGRDEEYIDILKLALCSHYHPDSVTLLEFEPLKQKTLPDFLATELYTDVSFTDICSIKKINNTLFHERGGSLVPIHRIFNRTIVDELSDNNVSLPFAWNDKIEVEWAGHPNWYFRMSKYSLPFLIHPSVPRTQFLNEIDKIPSDLGSYVLKPLYAFAGKGVKVSPTESDLMNIPSSERHLWILMDKIQYADCLYTPLGMNRLEIRCMLIWLPEWEKPLPTVSLVRSGRGTMMGARFNTDKWTGATVCLFGDE